MPSANTSPPSRDSATAPVPPVRALIGGFLMGLANLFPGVSGGTMILALGLYDRVIGAVAKLSSFRWSLGLFVFLGFLGAGLLTALLGLSGLMVGLVVDHTWVMYSLFIGLTLGGVPELKREMGKPGAIQWLALVLGIAAMAAFFYGLRDAAVPQNFVSFALVGALAAASMILPGISGSTVLLVFGMYEIVWVSVSPSSMKEDFMACVQVVGPIGLGAAIGLALLSNLLKYLLAHHRATSHAALLGLLLGSLLVLFPPFQRPVHPDLANKDTRKAVTLLVQGSTPAEIQAERGYVFEPGDVERLGVRYKGKSPAELKELSDARETFSATPTQWGSSLLLILLGFGLTQLLGYRGSSED